SSMVSFFRVPADERVSAIVQQNGAVTKFNFDVTDRVTVVTDADGNAATYKFDKTGRVTEVDDPLGGVTQYTWATLPSGDIQLTDRIAPLGQDVHYDYDSRGNVTKQTLKAATSSPVVAPGSGAEQVTQSTYSAKFNEITTLTDALGNVTTYEYDPHGNLLKTT